jgi:hypothetical protein
MAACCAAVCAFVAAVADAELLLEGWFASS